MWLVLRKTLDDLYFFPVISAGFYLERLSQQDLALLGQSANEAVSTQTLLSDPAQIPALLQSPDVYQRLFLSGREDPLLFASPFLAFSVLIARARADLQETTHVPEWLGPRRSVPVFDVEQLRDFMGDDLRRVFLADLLSSYTRVASGVTWVKRGRSWSRRRFSELDPGHLAQLVLEAPVDLRLPIYRRLGDLSLFLSGIFPDHVGGRLLGPVSVGRIERALGLKELEERAPGPLDLLEEVGRRSYRMAYEATVEPRIGMARVLGEVVERFRDARRILNLMTQKYLFPLREAWFGGAS